MAKYDPKIIEKFCDQLYTRADRLVLACVVFFTLAFGVVGGSLLASVSQNDSTRVAVFLVTLFFSCAIGYGFGQHLAFKYRLQAQITLLQLEIERNTRKSGG